MGRESGQLELRVEIKVTVSGIYNSAQINSVYGYRLVSLQPWQHKYHRLLTNKKSRGVKKIFSTPGFYMPVKKLFFCGQKT